MSIDKSLTEAHWKAFAKGGSYKDAALLKALTALDKAQKQGPDAELKALDEIEQEAASLRKAHKADKDLSAQLDKLDKAASAHRKQAEQSRKQQQNDEDEDEDSPALLTTKLLPLMRQVPKGDTLHAMVVTGGTEAAVMLARRPIAPARAKVLKEYLGVSGGSKIILGTCIFEAGAHTFVLQTQAAGMAKRLKEALRRQLELRFKVRVRGLDPNDVDEAAEDDPQAGPDTNAPESSIPEPPEPPSSTPPQPPEPPPMPGQQASPEEAARKAFEARFAAMAGRLQQALRNPAADASKIRALVAFAQSKAGSAAYTAAAQGLDALEKMLAALDGQAPSPVPPPPDAAAAFNARLAALLPQAKTVIAAGTPEGQAIKLQVSEAGALARQRDFAAAHALLDQVQAALAKAGQDLTGSQNQGEPDVPQGQQQPIREEGQSSGQPQDPQAEQNVASNDDPVGNEAPNQDAPPVDKRTLLNYRKSLLAFRTAKDLVSSRIQALKAAIPNQLPDQANLADLLAQTLDEQNEELLDLVDRAFNASQDPQSPATQELAEALDAYIADLSDNELVQEVDRNPFGVATDIESTLVEALTRIRDRMPLAA